MPTVPHSASELARIVATGNGQDVLDAVEAMNATHGEFLTGMWTHTDNGYVYMDCRPDEPASPEIVQRKYGPMTPVDGA